MSDKDTHPSELKIILEQIDTWSWELNTVQQADELSIDHICYQETAQALLDVRRKVLTASNNFQYRMDRAKRMAAESGR